LLICVQSERSNGGGAPIDGGRAHGGTSFAGQRFAGVVIEAFSPRVEQVSTAPKRRRLLPLGCNCKSTRTEIRNVIGVTYQENWLPEHPPNSCFMLFVSVCLKIAKPTKISGLYPISFTAVCV